MTDPLRSAQDAAVLRAAERGVPKDPVDKAIWRGILRSTSSSTAVPWHEHLWVNTIAW